MNSTVSKVRSQLSDVPETTLWTLHNRATEAMRPHGLLNDPLCVHIYQNIDYDYEKMLGKADLSHAVRSYEFDQQIKKYLIQKPNGLVIGLGEGLETQAYRCDNGQNRWISVDLPSAIEFREKFIKSTDRFQHISKSALDLSWMDSIQDEFVFITAQGLFMYFTESEVESLIKAIDQKFTRYFLMFDTIPHWFSKMTLKGWQKTPNYKVPPMPWGISTNEIEPVMKKWLSSPVQITLNDFNFPRGLEKYLFSILKCIPILKTKKPNMVLISKT